MRLLSLSAFLLVGCATDTDAPLETDTAMGDTAVEVEIFEPTRMYVHMKLGLQGGQVVTEGPSASSMGFIFTGSPWYGDHGADVGNHCTVVFPGSAMQVDIVPSEGRLGRMVVPPDSEYELVGEDCAHLPENAWDSQSLHDIAAGGLSLFVTHASGALDPVVASARDELGFASYLDTHIEWDGSNRLMAAAGATELDNHSAFVDVAALEALPGDTFVEVWPSQYYDRPLD